MAKFGYANLAGAALNVTQYGFSKVKLYNKYIIRGIKDGSQGQGDNLPVAVPSPFARLFLTKNAFEHVTSDLQDKKKINESGNDEKHSTNTTSNEVFATNEDHRLVSDTLDLIELAFFTDRLSFNEITFESLNEESISNPKIKNLLETLNKYIEADKDSLKISEKAKNEGNKDIYALKMHLIKYEDKAIGLTSWQTLFCATADREFLKKIKAVDGVELFSEIRGFDKRNEKVKALLKYFAEIGILADDTAIKNYIDFYDSYDKKNAEYQELKKNLRPDSIPKSERKEFIALKESINEDGEKVRSFKIGEVKLEWITPLKNLEASLQIENWYVNETPKEPSISGNLGNGKVTYWYSANGKEDGEYQTEKPEKVGTYYVKAQIEKSEGYNSTVTMPFRFEIVEEYIPLIPFEDYIIKLGEKASQDYKLLQVEDGSAYLFPIKSDKYFSEVLGKIPNIDFANAKVTSLANAIKVSLSIDGTLHSKIYTKISPEGDVGQILDTGRMPFNISLFPFVKNSKEYRIQVMKKSNLQILEINGENGYTRTDKGDIQTSYYKLPDKDNCSAIRMHFSIDGKNFYAWAIPNFKEVIQHEDLAFSFAVDFGTTNTHVECISHGGDQSHNFFELKKHLANLLDIEELSTNNKDFKETLQDEFLPLEIGDKFKFPIRTLLSAPEGSTRNTSIQVLGKHNIVFTFGENQPKPYTKYIPDIKWSQEKYAATFIEEIAFLMYAKVKLDGGNLRETRISYLYPLSMKNKKNLDDIWNHLYKKWFDENDNKKNLIKVPESIAPYKYYAHYSAEDLNIEIGPVLCIDIGGGTTDVILLRNNNKERNVPTFQISFKFAGNSILGDFVKDTNGREQVVCQNAFTKYYLPKILNSLNRTIDDKKPYQKQWEFLSYLKKMRSEEINSYLFSLGKIITLEEDRLESSYASILKQDEKLKFVFLYFISSIIYHIADVIKQQWKGIIGEENSPLPFVTNIIFSGNGSKILDLIDDSEDRERLKGIVSSIFEKVYERDMDDNEKKFLKIKFDKEKCKTLTSKGALVFEEKTDGGVDNELKSVVLYNKYKTSKSSVDDSQKAVDSIANFHKIFLEILTEDIIKEFEMDENIVSEFEKSALSNQIKNIVNASKEEDINYFFVPLQEFLLKFLDRGNYWEK